MLQSVEHEMKIFLLINVKIPTIVGILTFKSRKNSILGLYDPKNAKFPDIVLYLWAFKFHAQLSWAWKKFYNLRARYIIVRLRVLVPFLRVAENKKKSKQNGGQKQ